MARGLFRGIERPPVWATIVMVLAVLWLVGASVLTAGRGSVSKADVARANAQQEAAAAAASQSAAAVATLPKTVHSLVVFGDSYVDEGRVAGQPAGTYLDQLVKAMGWPKPEVFSTFGGGYMSPGSKGTFLSLVPQATSTAPDVVIVQGGRNDWKWDALDSGVTKTLAAVHQRWPHAVVVVPGILWPTPVPADVAKANTIIMRIASGYKSWAIPVDLIAKNFVYELSPDSVHPDVAGDRQLAAGLQAALATPS